MTILHEVLGVMILALALATIGLAVVLRFERGAWRPESESERLALRASPVQAELPVRQRAAITATRIWRPGEVTDAEHRARVTRDGS